MYFFNKGTLFLSDYFIIFYYMMNYSKMRAELNKITWDYILSSSGGKMNILKCATEFYSQQLFLLSSTKTEQEWNIFKEKYKIELQYKIKELIYQNRLNKIEGDFK